MRLNLPVCLRRCVGGRVSGRFCSEIEMIAVDGRRKRMRKFCDRNAQHLYCWVDGWKPDVGMKVNSPGVQFTAFGHLRFMVGSLLTVYLDGEQVPWSRLVVRSDFNSSKVRLRARILSIHGTSAHQGLMTFTGKSVHRIPSSTWLDCEQLSRSWQIHGFTSLRVKVETSVNHGPKSHEVRGLM